MDNITAAEKASKVIKRMLDMKAYISFNNLRAGDLVKIYCYERGCDKYLQAICNYPSTMQCSIVGTGQSYDMRNQVYYCEKHYH